MEENTKKTLESRETLGFGEFLITINTIDNSKIKMLKLMTTVQSTLLNY